MPPKEEAPTPAYQPRAYESSLKGLPGLLLFAQTADLVESGGSPQELLKVPTHYTPAMEQGGPTGQELAQVVEEAFRYASEKVLLSTHELAAFGFKAAGELRQLLSHQCVSKAIYDYIKSTEHTDQFRQAAYLVAAQLKATPRLVLQEWLLFSEMGQSSPPIKRYAPTSKDFLTLHEALTTIFEPIGSIAFAGKPVGLEGKSEVNLAALASASLPPDQKTQLEDYFAHSIVYLPLRLWGIPSVFDKPKAAAEGMRKLFDLGVDSQKALLAVIATCVRGVIADGQAPRRCRIGRKFFRLGDELQIVPCRDLPVCFFDAWLQREVIASFASMLPGWDDATKKGRTARDALDHEHQRSTLEETYDLANCGESSEARAQINEMLTLLKATSSEQQMEIIVLGLKGFSADEIGALRGTNGAQVRQQRHRAIAKMRKMHGDQKKAVTKSSPTRLA